MIAITPSPAYIFIGMMVRPITTVYIVLGAVVGWGILSPIAKSKGWAPGPTADWETGSQGWINWVALGLILGDAAVGIIWPIGRTLAASVFGRLQVTLLGEAYREFFEKSAEGV